MPTNNFCHAQQILFIKQAPNPCISQLLRVLLKKKNCRIQPPNLLFLVLYYILHQQTSFFTDIQNFIQHYLKRKIFVTYFIFSPDSLRQIPPHHHINSQNLLIRVTKVFAHTPLTVIYIYIYILYIYIYLLGGPIYLQLFDCYF